MNKRIEDIYDFSSQPNAHEDSDPPSTKCRKEEVDLLKKSLPAFGDNMHTEFESKNGEGEELCMEFISTFRPHSNIACPKGLTYEWSKLRIRGVHVDVNRGISQCKRFCSTFFREKHIMIISAQMEKITDRSSETASVQLR